jgi:lipopolysaccharide export LptBFGC system permease protein LptF
VNTLDRHILSAAFTRWAMVLFLGVFLILLGDFIGNMGVYLGAVAAHRGTFLAEFFLLRFPEFMATWLPLSAAVAGLLTAAPMIRQGTLVALMAAGVAPRRAYSSLLVLAVAIGLLGLVLKDQVIPRLDGEAKLARQRMVGRLGADEEKPRAVGWREGDHFWSSLTALPDDADYRNVAAFSAEGSRTAGTMLIADRLHWQDGQWLLTNAAVVSDETAPYRVFATCRIADTGLTLSSGPRELAGRLVLDSHKTSDELLTANASVAGGMIALRVGFGMLPLLCLLFALPGFIRLEGRSGVGTMVGKALLMTLVPIGVYWLLSRLLVAHGANALATSIAALTALLGVGAWRWWFMRM